MPACRKFSETRDCNATIGFEQKLWLMGDKLHIDLEAAADRRAERDGSRASKYGTIIDRVRLDPSEGDRFEEMMRHLVAGMWGQFAESGTMEQVIGSNLGGLGYALRTRTKRNPGASQPQAVKEGIPGSTSATCRQRVDTSNLISGLESA
jgi:hypothetical protein